MINTTWHQNIYLWVSLPGSTQDSYFLGKNAMQRIHIGQGHVHSNMKINFQQFEAAVPQLHTFHVDLHPPTHVQLKSPR
jgi:hypothetical protein